MSGGGGAHRLQLQAFLTLVLDGGERLASRPVHLIPRKGDSDVVRWAHRGGLDLVVKERDITPLVGIEGQSADT